MDDSSALDGLSDSDSISSSSGHSVDSGSQEKQLTKSHKSKSVVMKKTTYKTSSNSPDIPPAVTSKIIETSEVNETTEKLEGNNDILESQTNPTDVFTIVTQETNGEKMSTGKESQNTPKKTDSLETKKMLQPVENKAESDHTPDTLSTAMARNVVEHSEKDTTELTDQTHETESSEASFQSESPENEEHRPKTISRLIENKNERSENSTRPDSPQNVGTNISTAKNNNRQQLTGTSLETHHSKERMNTVPFRGKSTLRRVKGRMSSTGAFGQTPSVETSDDLRLRPVTRGLRSVGRTEIEAEKRKLKARSHRLSLSKTPESNLAVTQKEEPFLIIESPRMTVRPHVSREEQRDQINVVPELRPKQTRRRGGRMTEQQMVTEIDRLRSELREQYRDDCEEMKALQETVPETDTLDAFTDLVYHCAKVAQAVDNTPDIELQHIEFGLSLHRRHEKARSDRILKQKYETFKLEKKL